MNGGGINKGGGVGKVGERIGWRMENVMLVGERVNDMGMIEEGGLGIGMGNGEEVVKEAGDWMTGGKREEGVGKGMEDWVVCK